MVSSQSLRNVSIFEVLTEFTVLGDRANCVLDGIIRLTVGALYLKLFNYFCGN